MKKLRLIPIVILLPLLSGCIYTSFSYDGTVVKGKRLGCLYPFETGPFTYATSNVTVRLEGYKTDGGTDTAAAVTEAAVTAALKQAKP